MLSQIDPARGRFRVDCFRKRMERDALLFQIIKQIYASLPCTAYGECGRLCGRREPQRIPARLS